MTYNADGEAVDLLDLLCASGDVITSDGAAVRKRCPRSRCSSVWYIDELGVLTREITARDSGPQIVRRSIHRQPIEGDQFSPGRFDGETSAH